MEFPIGLIYDLIFLVLLLGGAILGKRRGFLSGLVGLVGSVAGILAGVYASRNWASSLYYDHIGVTIGETVTKSMAETGGDLAAAINSISFLPDAVREKLTTALTNLTAAAVPQIVNALAPVLLPMLQAVFFLLVWVAARALFHLLARWLRGINALPLVGTVNKVLGFALGFVSGTLNCWILSLALWLIATVSGGKLEVLNFSVLQSSALYRLLETLNPFVVHY
ncbi:MAG: CvpA family protein [Oscillospiraceae bacterium]|nr:CvpA family protein [Oscillospiraceae bacterium]